MHKPRIKITESLVFREATTADELIALLKLKTSVYADSRMSTFQSESADGIVMDCFDQFSRHFGLYAIVDGVRQPIGYIRVAEDCRSGANQVVLTAIEELGLNDNSLKWSSEKPFPIISHSPDAKQVLEFYHASKKKNERIVEPGRLVLDPEYRSLRNAVSLVESAIAIYFFSLRVNYALITCVAHSAKFYSRYGFENLPGTNVQHWEKADVDGITLIGSPDSVPNAHRERISALARQFEANHEIRFDRKKKAERQLSAVA